MSRLEIADNGCARVCCSDFEIDESPEELFERWLTLCRKAELRWSAFSPPPWDLLEEKHDVEKMMFLFMHQYETETGNHYKCKAWDKKTGNCKAYEWRPQVCRDYPGKDGCEFKGCRL